MTRLEQIERDIRRRKAQIRLFLRYAHRAGIRPFFGEDRWNRAHGTIAVTPDLRKEGVWRVTWFGDGEPHGHAEARGFDEAVTLAVREYGLDLDTVQFHAERDQSRRARRIRIRQKRSRPRG